MKTPLCIIEKFVEHSLFFLHRGKRNAIKRPALLEIVRHHFDEKISKRILSKAYEDLPLCGMTEGLYWPETEEEREHQISRNLSWIQVLYTKNKNLKKLNIPPQPIQPDLF